jgi:ubiquinone/menaquinone biosynthesis C-methylase UbiE
MRKHNAADETADKAEEKVSRFYNTVGWRTEEDITEDARRWEDLRENAAEYVSKCRLRILRHIPGSGDKILDMASGPIQYKEYLEYSRNFLKRYCVDLSSDALQQAKKKIGEHGVFLHGSFFDLPLENDFFDCAISLHTIFHIDKARQEEAVRKLIRVTKPGKPVIILYGNPYTLVSLVRLPVRVFRKVRRILTRSDSDSPQASPGLYYHTHPLSWWNRFSDVSTVSILPWRSFDSDAQKILFPDTSIGKRMFHALFRLEDAFPWLFVRLSQYPMIILLKN